MNIMYKKMQLKIINELYKKNVISDKQFRFIKEIIEKEISKLSV